MNKDNLTSFKQIILAVIGLGFALVLIRFPFPSNLIALSLLLLLLFGYYYYNLLKEKKAKREYDATLLGKLDQQKDSCLSKIAALKREMKTINANIKDLNKQLLDNPDVTEQAKHETNKLINGFNEEKKLRESKIEFYQLCISKLDQIFKNHKLTEDLKAKREKLEALKESNIEEVADMEGMKTFIDYEQEYIETIDTLSLKMLDSRSIENVEVLQLELVEMTKELHEL